ncbi:MAG TPA: hypothetical protein ENN55_03390 [Firmicutes bacterium]|nr:hypothetical protein [Bacillota bacterium]
MKCSSCGNTEGFLVMVTDYKPLEMWEFSNGSLTRYCQQDAGDKDESITCGACGSDEIDREGFNTDTYTERPLVVLPEGEWEEKMDEMKKPEAEEESEEENESEESGEEAASEEQKENEAPEEDEEKEENKE